MGMEIINKSHKKITSNTRIDLASYIRIDKKTIYFSAGAVMEFGLQKGLSVNFINDDDQWLFYCDTNEDGFKLIERLNKKALLICDASLVNLFVKRTRMSLPCKFLLKELKSRLNGIPLVKIEILNPLEI